MLIDISMCISDAYQISVYRTELNFQSKEGLWPQYWDRDLRAARRLDIPKHPLGISTTLRYIRGHLFDDIRSRPPS